MIVSLHKWDHHIIPKEKELTLDMDDAFNLIDNIFTDGNELYNGLHDGYLSHADMGLRDKLVINEHAAGPVHFARPFSRFRSF